MWLWLLIMLIVIFLIWAFAIRNDEAKVSLKIATYGCNIQVENLRLGNNYFWVYVVFDNDYELQFLGNTIGEVQFKISKFCKEKAQNRDGVNFKKNNTDDCCFEVGVEKDGQVLTYSQYDNLTTSEMRSTKRPIVGYYHSDGFEPMWGPSDHPIRAKL